jgi:hypothetical protein
VENLKVGNRWSPSERQKAMNHLEYILTGLMIFAVMVIVSLYMIKRMGDSEYGVRKPECEKKKKIESKK